jgi:hypothetical protein
VVQEGFEVDGNAGLGEEFIARNQGHRSMFHFGFLLR